MSAKYFERVQSLTCQERYMERKSEEAQEKVETLVMMTATLNVLAVAVAQVKSL